MASETSNPAHAGGEAGLGKSFLAGELERFPSSKNAAQNQARLRHLANQIHQLGPYPLAHLFIELSAGAELLPTLEAYAELEPLADLIACLDGRDLPAPRVIAGGRR